MQHALLKAEGLSLGYDGHPVVRDLSITVPEGKISVILGENGCGKSTLLKSFARLIKPQAGTITLNGDSIARYPAKQFARTLGLLPQSPVAPEGLRVLDLVARGRFPFQKPLRGMTKEDFAAVNDALEMMGVASLADRCVDELSGGQRQRVWIAMVLAQNTKILLLDEPTTYLDIAYQVDILETLHALNRARGVTIVMVLHDVNLAIRYADHIFALRDGMLLAQGAPKDVMTEALMRQLYRLDCLVMTDPLSGAPHIIPRGRRDPANQTLSYAGGI